jgi:hypothetical protein
MFEKCVEKKSVAMFEGRVERSEQDLERRQQIALVFSFPNPSRCELRAFGASTMRSKHRF